jgi:hypothetical protein
MKSSIFFLGIAAFVAAFALLPQSASAKIWRVNNNLLYVASATPGQPCSHCFTNLQEAINSTQVSFRDTLHVEASPTPYKGIVINNNKRLVLLGPGYFLNENPGLQQNQVSATIEYIDLEPGSAGTILKGLRIEGFKTNEIGDSDITIERCSFQLNIYFQNVTAALKNISIRQNYLEGQLYGTSGYGPVSNLLLSNNYFGGKVDLPANYQGIATQNVFNNGVAGFSGMTYYNNIIRAGTFVQNTNSTTNVFKNIFHNKPTWLDVPNATNFFNIVMTSVFGTIGSTDGKLDPLPSCSVCPNGHNGHEIGMYGGNDPYRKSGPPDIPSIPELLPDATVVQGGTLPVKIRTRTNN